MRQLDPEAVQAFVLVTDLRSFTRAARAMNTTQSAVSLKISRLEKRLDRRLFERTPRMVRLSTAGEAFLTRARALTEAYKRAVDAFEDKPGRLVFGLSHHIVGDNLPILLRSLPKSDGSTVLDLRIGPTRGLLDAYDAGELDAVVILRHDESRRGGEIVMTETFQWMAAHDFVWRGEGPLPLLLQAEPCKLRAMTVSALGDAKVPWREAFLGTGVTSIAGAAVAGLGIAAISRRCAPVGLVDVGVKFKLPLLPGRPVIIHSNVSGKTSLEMLRSLLAAFRQSSMQEAMQAAE